MFNEDQRAHMRELAATPAEDLAWCGWYRMHEDPHPECPRDLTAADKLRQRCEVCGNAPSPDTGRMTHLAGCTPAERRDHYAELELGEAGA